MIVFISIQHFLNHLKVLSHRMPGHLGPLGDGAIIRLVGAKPHVLPDLPLFLSKFLRRWDPSGSVNSFAQIGLQPLA